MNGSTQQVCGNRAAKWLSLPHLVITPVLIVSLMLNTGCATYLLWDNEWFDNRKEPASDPRVRLFQDERVNDYLVQYLEADESSGKIRPRVYYLFENELAVMGEQRPRFLKALPDSGLIEIPVYPHVAITNESDLPASTCAIMTIDNNGFTVYLEDGSQFHTRLPEYSGKVGRVGRVLLTPITVAIDTAVTVAVIYVILKLESDSDDRYWYD